MDKKEIIEAVKKYGMTFVYKYFDKLEECQQKELLVNALWLILDNNLQDKYYDVLQDNLY